MSEILPKDKKKRSRSSSNEASNSFIKNVTSRMSAFLPETITRWFSSPSASNANGSAPTAEPSDSSTEDEALESPELGRPPAKRMRYTTPVIFNHYTYSDANNVTNNITNLEQCSPYETVQSPPGRTTFRRETHFVSTPLRSPNDESAVDKSEKDSTVFKPQHTISTTSTSVAPKRKSLFGSPFNSEASVKACAQTASNIIKDPNQPRFKPSLLGSPFYPGRTMYGGASASYINHANIKQRKNTLVNETNINETNAISHSARRVMDLLENYSSPLTEARRIPPYVRPNIHSLNNNLDCSSHNDSHRVALYNKTQELHVPSIASILRLKKNSRLMDTTSAARQILASHSSTSDYLPYPTGSASHRDEMEKESSNKFTTKVKTRLTRTNRGENIEQQADPSTSVNLPSAILQIDQEKLLNFSFGIPVVSNATISDTTRTSSITECKTQFSEIKTTSVITETPIRKPDTVPNINSYKFSSPVKISRETPSSTTPPKFAFGSPERSIDKTKINENNVDEPSWFVGTPKEPEVKAMGPKPKDWKCSNCWVVNKIDVEQCVCCESQKPSPDDKNKKTAKCSVCKVGDAQYTVDDKCGNCEQIKDNNICEPFSSKLTGGDYWVENDAGPGICVCCDGKNPEQSAPVVKQTADTSNTGSEFKSDDFWIHSSVHVCDACGGSRPSVAPSSPPAPGLFMSAPKPNEIKNAVVTQSQKWECPSCLVRNDSDKNKCVCCDTNKPGATKESENTSFKFGVNTTFKFGIDPKAQEVNISNLIKGKTTFDTKEKIEESETNNNVVSKFIFGIPAKKFENQTDTNKNVEENAQSVPKVGFTFGVPQSSSTPAATSTLEVPNDSPTTALKVIEDMEKPQVVPKVDFTITKTLTAQNLFTSPLSTEAKSDITTVSPILNTSVTLLNKDTPLNPLASAVTLAGETPKQNFTFASAEIKPAVNMFAVPPSAAAIPATTVMSFMLPAESTPATSKVSMFQKSDSPKPAGAISLFQTNDSTSPSVSLFQKSESSAVAPPSLGATAPMFSFGANNVQTAMSQSQPEKQKFNFTFGSANKSEASMLFKPIFGATTDSTSTNTFTMSTENALGNSLSSNALGGGIGMLTRTVTNPLAGGSESNNPLTSGNALKTNNVLPPTGGIFGAPVQKENIWSSSNNTSFNNMFTSNATPNNLQKPAAFTFGSSTPFNAPSATPSFGGVAQSTPNMFGIVNTGNQTVPNIFASPQSVANAAPSMGMFSTPPTGATPAFGPPNPSLPTFETPTPAPAPAFNFSAQQSTNIFGFTQQPQQPPQQQPSGLYSFGTAAAAGGASPHVQFNMGSAPNMRRVRKAVRRNTPR